MCGIAGFLAPGNGWDSDRLGHVARSMADCLEHRGPDDAGSWVDPESGIALGHRRLAVLDVSPLGHQPMVSQHDRFVLSYNGEIYNFREIRQSLIARGHSFRSESDTEVILAAFEEHGVVETLPLLNGMFAMSIWDRTERELWLVRDRMGQKPLYVGVAGHAALFASELTPLRQFPDFRAEIDRDALSLLLRRGCIGGQWSIYRGIRKVLPGHYVRLRSDAPLEQEQVCYWSLGQIAAETAQHPFAGSLTEATEELDALLRKAVRNCMVSDVPLGAFLSGGIDSSTIAALMTQVAHGPVKTFSIGFSEAGFDEAPHAARVASHLGTDHTELYVSHADVLEVIPKLPSLYDEPFADASQVPTYLVSKLARAEVTVALTGDGGDELFCGYAKYHLFERLRRIAALPRALRRAAASGLALAPPRIRRAASVIAEAENPADLYVHLASIWKNPEEIVRAAQEPPTILTQPASWPAVPDPLRQVMTVDALSYLPDDILTKVDRAAMAVSLETRIPLLDHHVVEFAVSLPTSMCYDGTISKRPLRRVLGRYAPEELFTRPKMGFDLPLGNWLRDELRDWAEGLLSAEAIERGGHFNTGAVRGVWSEHLERKGDRSGYLWPILVFLEWEQQH